MFKISRMKAYTTLLVMFTLLTWGRSIGTVVAYFASQL